MNGTLVFPGFSTAIRLKLDFNMQLVFVAYVTCCIILERRDN